MAVLLLQNKSFHQVSLAGECNKGISEQIDKTLTNDQLHRISELHLSVGQVVTEEIKAWIICYIPNKSHFYF